MFSEWTTGYPVAYFPLNHCRPDGLNLIYMRYYSLLVAFFMLAFSACNSTNSNASATTDATTDAPAAMAAETAKAEPYPKNIEELDGRYPEAAKAYVAGGCFWCTEASFERIQGVEAVWSGYTGGEEKNPTYEQVSNKQTGHTEAIVIYYDPEVLDFNTLLEVFFVAHDPTQVNRQGPDVGPQYRSGIYPLNAEQRTAAEAKIKELNASGKFSSPIATEVVDATEFYLAEEYHQDYYDAHPNQGYIANVSRPKVEKVMKTFADILKPEYR